MPRLRGAGVAIIGVVLLGSSALAGPIEDAKTAIDASDYFAARATLDKVLQAGTNKPAELAEIYRLTGIAYAALGDAKVAKEAFQKCLALAPRSTLPPGTSPKIGKPFTAAQDFFKDKQALEIKTSTTSDPPTVTVEVVSDPLQMIVKLQAVVVVDGKPEQEIDQPTAPSVKIDLPKGKRIDLRVNALDDKGNHLFEVGSKDVPIVIVGKADPVDVVVKKPPPPPKPVPAPARARPLYLQWWLWAGASVAFLGAGSYFAIDAVRAKNQLDDLGAESGNHPFDTVQAVEDRARRSVLFANIGLITGGVFALTTGVLYLTRPKQSVERRTVLTPTASSRSVGVAFGGTF